MKLIFLEDVSGVARAGEVKEVADGYGRNYLLPRKLAALATPSELKRLEKMLEKLARERARTVEEAGALAQNLREVSLVLKARVGEGERLYGSITNADISEELEKVSGHKVDKHMIVLEEPIRRLGTFQVPIKLAKDVTTEVQVIVEAA